MILRAIFEFLSLETMKQWGIALALSLLAYFTPIFSLMLAVTILTIVDWATHQIVIYKTGLTKEGKCPAKASRSLYPTIIKIGVFNVALGLVFLVEHNIMCDSMILTKIIFGVIATKELISNLENLSRISNSPFLRKAGDILLRKISKMTDMDENELTELTKSEESDEK